MGQIRSLSEPLGDEEDYTLGDAVASDENMEADVIRKLDRENMSRKLWEAVDTLPGEQADVIRLRFKEGMQQIDTAATLGITVGKAIVLRDKAFRTLRTPHRSQGFKGYYDEYMRACSYRHVGVRTFQRTWTSEVEKEALGL